MLASRRAVFVGLLAATTLVFSTDGVVSVNLVPYAATLAFPAAAIGLLATVHRLVRLPLGPWVGLQADRRGRRPLLLAGVFGAAVSLLVLGATQGFAPLLAARLLYGASSAAIATAGLASVLDVGGRRDSGGLIGSYQAALYGTYPLGTVAGGVLADALGYRPTFLVCGVLALVGGAVALALVRETRPAVVEDSARKPTPGLRDYPRLLAPVWPYAAMKMANGFAVWGVFSATFVLYMLELRETRALAGALLGLVFVLGFLVGSPLVGVFTDRFDRRQLLGAASLPLAAIGLGALAAAPLLPLVVAGVVALGLAVALASAPLATLCGEAAPPDARAAVMAAYNTLSDLANSAGTILGTSLALGVGYRPTYAATALVVLAVAVPLSLASARRFGSAPPA